MTPSLETVVQPLFQCHSDILGSHWEVGRHSDCPENAPGVWILELVGEEVKPMLKARAGCGRGQEALVSRYTM